MSKPKILKIFDNNTEDKAYSRLNNPVTVSIATIDDIESLVVDQDIDVEEGTILTFTAPCNCPVNREIGSFIVINGTRYSLVDSKGESPGGSFEGFSKGSKISILISESPALRAYILNGAYDGGMKPSIHINLLSEYSSLSIEGPNTSITTELQYVGTNTYSLDVEEYGHYIIRGTRADNSGNVDTVYLFVGGVGRYDVALTSFNITLTVTGIKGTSITCKNLDYSGLPNSTLEDHISEESEEVSFLLFYEGTWDITAEFEGKTLTTTFNTDLGNQTIDMTISSLFSYGTEDLTAGVSELETGKLYFVYE